mgnify:CR=1 FL=1
MPSILIGASASTAEVFAILCIDAEGAAKLVARVEAVAGRKRDDPDLIDVRFQGAPVSFYDISEFEMFEQNTASRGAVFEPVRDGGPGDVALSAALDDVEGGGAVVLDPALDATLDRLDDVDGVRFDTGSPIAVVTEDAVRFVAFGRHDGADLTSNDVPVDVLRQVAGGPA